MTGAVLRVGGSKQAVREFLATTRMEPLRTYLQGEPTSFAGIEAAVSLYPCG